MIFVKNIEFSENMIYEQQTKVLYAKFYKIVYFDQRILPLNTCLNKNELIDFSLLATSFVTQKTVKI